MSRFSIDTLSRTLAQPESRRRLLQLLGAGAAGATITAVGLTSTEAKKGGNGKGKGKGKGGGKGKEKVTICHKGKTITVARPAVAAHLAHGDTEGACGTGDTCLPVTGTEGDVTSTNGTYTATTTGTNDFGNLVFDVPDTTTFAEINTLASSFSFTQGGCGVGSPRFVVFLENGRCPYAQFPPELCDTEDQGSTGNLVGNQTEFVWNDDLCGGDATNTTYADVLADYATVEVDRIVLVTDSSSGEATVTLEPCITLVQS